MNRVAAVLSPERIRLGFSAVNKSQVLDEASRLLASFEGLEPNHITASLTARERLGSTGLGAGVAIPHARLQGLRQAIAAFIRLSFAVAFDSPDGKPVTEVLVLLVPEQATEEHLELLAQAAEMFNDRRFRDQLHKQTDVVDVYQAFVDWPMIAQ